MIFCQMMYRYPILLDAYAAALKRKGDTFLAKWADIMTGKSKSYSHCICDMKKSEIGLPFCLHYKVPFFNKSYGFESFLSLKVHCYSQYDNVDML